MDKVWTGWTITGIGAGGGGDGTPISFGLLRAHGILIGCAAQPKLVVSRAMRDNPERHWHEELGRIGDPMWEITTCCVPIASTNHNSSVAPSTAVPRSAGE